jgi:hypothetical protein
LTAAGEWRLTHANNSISEGGFRISEFCDMMGKWIGQIRRMRTIFFETGFKTEQNEKIRSHPPNLPFPFSHYIPKIPQSAIHIPKSENKHLQNIHTSN